jgi:cell cycle checkpoint protein
MVDKNIFSSYKFTPAPHTDDDEEESDHSVSFGISLAALLECLQIFGADTYREKWQGNNSGAGGAANTRAGVSAVFDQQVLRIGGTCRISYQAPGHPLSLTCVKGASQRFRQPANQDVGWKKTEL